MVEWLKQLAYALALRLKSRARLEAENLMLRQQLNIAIRKLRSLHSVVTANAKLAPQSRMNPWGWTSALMTP